MESDKRDLRTTLMSSSNKPWLIYIHGKQRSLLTFYSISEKKCPVKSIDMLSNIHLCTASHGWMVLCADSLCFLYNPITAVKIQLPDLNIGFNACVLSSSPDDPNCTVIFITYEENDFFVFRFCNPQSKVDCWIRKEVKFVRGSFVIGAVSTNGKVYVCMNNGPFRDVFIIKAIHNDLTVEKIGIGTKIPYPERQLYGNSKLVESCGELYTVRYLYEGFYEFTEILGFEIFKFDFEKKCWERVNSIGKRAFCFGHRTSCSAPAEDFECGIIYTTQFNDQSLYAYNVKEKSITMSLPCPNVLNNWSRPDCFLPSSSDKNEEK